MKNQKEIIHKQLVYHDGRYEVDIDITTDEWKEMLLNDKIFDEPSKNMIMHWYFEDNHSATSKDITTKYFPNLKSSPYNGIVLGLSKRILKHLDNRFWVEGSKGESFWCIPFEGWHVDYNPSNLFVWKVRNELVKAIDEIINQKPDFNKENSASNEIIQRQDFDGFAIEGRKKAYYSTTYERKSKNRDKAIYLCKMKNNGKLICEVCGFNFEEAYGEWGKDFIEVHHNKPLYIQNKEEKIDPENDLTCLCSNCHSMIHRDKDNVLTVEQLKNIIKNK